MGGIGRFFHFSHQESGMGVEERIEQLESQYNRLKKQLRFLGMAILIIGIYTTILVVVR